MGGNQAWSSQVVIANKIVIEGDQDYLLVYDGTPQFGNLIVSIAAAEDVDTYGNPYLPGISCYDTNGNTGAIGYINILQQTVTIGSVDGMTFQDFQDSGSFGGNTTNVFINSAIDPANPVATAAQGSMSLQSGAANAVTGSAAAPNLLIWNFAGFENTVVDIYLTGTLIHAAQDGTREAWHVVGSGAPAAAFQPNWATSVTMGTLTPVQALRYRKDPLDNVIIEGCWAAGSTAPGAAVFTLPAGYRPKTGHSITITKNAAGTVTTAKGYVSAAGNLNLNSQLGTSVTASATYMVDETPIPLDNIP